MKIFKKLSHDGFTAIELLIVVVVVGFLAGIILVKYQDVVRSANDSDRKSEVSQIEQRLSKYYVDNNSYPSTLADLSDLPADLLTDSKGLAYSYKATSEDGGKCMTEADDCANYSITATMENETEYNRTSS